MTELSKFEESEYAVVGAAFHVPGLPLILPLQVSDFGPWTGLLWELATQRARRGVLLSVSEIAKRDEKLGAFARTIADWGAVSNNSLEVLTPHVATIKEAAARRRLSEIAQAMLADANNLDVNPTEAMAKYGVELQRATPLTSAIGKRALAERVATELVEDLACYPTGLRKLDEVLGGGLFCGKLYGLAARKKVGKTALLGTISDNFNRAGIKHLFIGLEMSAVEIEQRNIARRLGFNSIAFLRRDRPDLPNRVADYAVTVDDNTVFEHRPGATLDEVRSMVAGAKMHHGIKGVILDYWQLVGGKGKGETEEYHLRIIAQWFADVCRRDGLFGMIAAQINQEGNTRGGEGLKLACDCYLTLHREKDSEAAWVEMEESRYTLYANVGSELVPGLIFHKHGPHFQDAIAPAEVPTRSFNGYQEDKL